MRIVFSRPAQVSDHEGEVVDDAEILRSLHNLVYADETFTEYLGGPEPEDDVREMLEPGGLLRFVYKPDVNQLWSVTDYVAKRTPTESELDCLRDYTEGQWSDGIGENFVSESEPLCGFVIDASGGLDLGENVIVEQIDGPAPEIEGPPFDRIKPLQISAGRGNHAALMILGSAYEKGAGVDKELPKALIHYEQAAAQGITAAMIKAGYFHAEGRSTPVDSQRALEWYRKAAEVGDPMGMGMVGACYETGAGVSQDLAEAVHWYQQGANKGHPLCLAELGECYEMGKGVPVDLWEAHKLYRKALEGGLEDVRPALERVAAALKPPWQDEGKN